MHIRRGVRQIGRWAAGVSLLITGVVGGLAGAVDAAPRFAPTQQQPVIVGAEFPLTGALDGAAPQVVYGFECYQGGVMSAYVETTTGDLMVDIAVFDPASQPLATGQMEQKNPNISIAEAFVAPADGQCTIQLSRVGETVGTYALRVLPGYAQLDKWEAFDGAGPPLRMQWPVAFSDVVDIAIRDQRLDMQVMLNGQYGFALPEDDGLNWSDVYVQAEYVIDGDPSYYEYGFLLRSDYAGDNFYLVTVSSDGDWSYYYFGGDWYEIQPWTVHPVIDGTDRNPTLGVWLHGTTLKLYFNGRYVGEVVDPNGFAADGLVGLVIATRSSQYDILTMHVDNLVITRPFGNSSMAALPFGNQADDQTGDQPQPTATPVQSLTGSLGSSDATPTSSILSNLGSITKTPEPVTSTATGTATPTQPAPFVPTLPSLVVFTATPVPPQGDTLLNWASAAPQEIVRELQSYDLVPSGGSLSLTIPSSYGDTSGSGFRYYPLGQGRTFHNFVLTFTAQLNMGSLDSGCGMHFRENATSTSIGAVFANGKVYLAQWLGDGESHAASVYGDHAAVIGGLGAANRVTIVADGPHLLMYVNGERVAGADFDDATGEMALEMYVAADDAGGTQRTYCQLDDIWLWEF